MAPCVLVYHFMQISRTFSIIKVTLPVVFLFYDFFDYILQKMMNKNRGGPKQAKLKQIPTVHGPLCFCLSFYANFKYILQYQNDPSGSLLFYDFFLYLKVQNFNFNSELSKFPSFT